MTDHIEENLRRIIALQRRTQLEEGIPSADVRRERMRRLINGLHANKEALCDAIFEDFGGRSKILSLMTEVLLPSTNYVDAMEHIEEWMKPQQRHAHLPPGAQGDAWIEYQPLGVVGIMAPWNTPVNLTLSPLFGVLAAGNRAILKPSELTPRCSDVLANIFADLFDESEITVVNGDASVGATFARMPFDHLLFTGGTEVGKHIMRAAAENLVPVTLELGGKSPVVVSDQADLSIAADKILTGKMMNAGQICLSPDYAMVPEAKLNEFIDLAQATIQRQYPTLIDNPDYTSVINDRHYERLQGYLTDAIAKGAKVIQVNPANEDFDTANTRKIPPTLVTNLNEDMVIMQEEIFGPILLVHPYKTLIDAVTYINSKPRPLALYYFGDDEAGQTTVLENTMSGGVTINDVIRHAHQHDLPFGGVGPSGMGCYHGFAGFRQFSNERGIFRMPQSPLPPSGMQPPFSDTTRAFLEDQITGTAKAQ
jgi:coniferyl-aldehyde dehydrogenase